MHRMMHRSHVGDNRVIFADRVAALVFTHGVRMGGRVAGRSLSGLYLRNRKV